MLKYSLNIGAIIGLVLIGLDLLAFLLDAAENSLLNSLGYIVLALGLVYGIKSYRDKAKQGYISYGEAVKLGTLIAVAIAFLIAAFTYVYHGIIDDSFLNEMYEQQADELYQQEDIPEESLELSLKVLSYMLTPGVFSFMAFIGQSIIGILFSLIIAIFLKNPEPLFEEES